MEKSQKCNDEEIIMNCAEHLITSVPPFNVVDSVKHVEELPKGNFGDVCLVSGYGLENVYVYFDTWKNISEVEIAENIKEKPTNCKNCGAVINPHLLKCEFCGSFYW